MPLWPFNITYLLFILFECLEELARVRSPTLANSCCQTRPKTYQIIIWKDSPFHYKMKDPYDNHIKVSISLIMLQNDRCYIDIWVQTCSQTSTKYSMSLYQTFGR